MLLGGIKWGMEVVGKTTSLFATSVSGSLASATLEECAPQAKTNLTLTIVRDQGLNRLLMAAAFAGFALTRPAML